ncbi:MAG: hypothetical protein H5T97_04010 [Firmicutes bacterium]|nr:hypothetical protein [Bacillota bacterium]
MRVAVVVILLALFLLPAAASPEAFRLAGVVVGPAVAEDVYSTAAAAYAPEPPSVALAVYRPELSLRPPERLLVAPGRPAAASLAVRNAGTVPAEVRLVSWRYGDAPWRPEIVPPDRDPVPPESLAVSFSAAGRGLGYLDPGGAVAAAEPLALAPGEGRAVAAEVRAGPIPAGERREFALIVDLEVAPGPE